jgi:hypothetical protein
LAVLFDIDDGQEITRGDDEAYLLDIYLVYSIRDDPHAAEMVALTAKSEIERAFQSAFLRKATHVWSKIELRDCLVVSEEALTFRQANSLPQFNTDYISLRDPGQPISD